MALGIGGQLVPGAFGRVRAVQEEGAPGPGRGQHVNTVEQPNLVAGDEMGVGDEVGGADRVIGEAEVRHGHGARLLRVVDEVALRIAATELSHEFRRGLVGADRTVGPETVEHRSEVGRVGLKGRIDRETCVGHVVDNPDGEAPTRVGRREVVEHRFGHRRRELLRAEAVASTGDLGQGPRSLLRQRGERAEHVEMERVGRGARLLRAIEHGDAGGRLRQGGEQRLDRERPVQVDLQHPDLLPRRRQSIDGLGDGADGGAHDHDHALGVGGALVAHQSVAATGPLGQLIEDRLHDARHGVDERVYRLAGLEEHVGVLGRAPQHGMVRIETTAAQCGDGVVVDEGA